ncbi:Unknown protein [Striga hermonthica]|uniref:Pectin methylesterase CGR3 n=1 Tax=Striga hermonthica TaxID=68872 RepID=A0A9N7MNQ9_STRHE|nr:Unknown protein [Striga hermonthica]
MSRRPTAGRRLADSGSIRFVGALHSKSHTSPLLSIGLLVVGALLIIGYIYHGSGGRNGDIDSLNRLDGTQEVQRLIPILKKAYGDSMRKVLHVGPDTCSVVSQLLKEEDTEAWGVEPYELDETDSNCKSLLRKGVVRVADIKFPLPYGPKSFSLVIVSDALDYLSPKYLNKTVPELARVSADSLVILSGPPAAVVRCRPTLPPYLSRHLSIFPLHRRRMSATNSGDLSTSSPGVGLAVPSPAISPLPAAVAFPSP